MSWRTKRYGTHDGNIDMSSSATHNNAGLYRYGLSVEESYKSEIIRYKDTKINAK